MAVIKGGVTAAKGFLASGLAAGIKKSGKKDLALLYSEVPAVAAGAFTTNRFQASPVRISKLHLRNKMHQAIIVNSGNANCANGHAGDRAAVTMADYIARALCLVRREVLVASTGIIGRPLPVEKIDPSPNDNTPLSPVPSPTRSRSLLRALAPSLFLQPSGSLPSAAGNTRA